MASNEKRSIAVYAEQCAMKGMVCQNPEAKYGADWRESADLLVFEGTEAELRELCQGGTGFVARCYQAVLDYL